MNTQSEQLRIYCCSFCDKGIFKGFVTSLSIACPHCNEFVRIPEKIQDPLLGFPALQQKTPEI